MLPHFITRQRKTFCLVYETIVIHGFPKKIITDNGTEFRNKLVEEFCRENQIKIAHGALRTLTTQGLTARSNRSMGERYEGKYKKEHEQESETMVFVH